MDTYELNIKKNRYRAMKENVNKIISVLSSNNIVDNIDMAENNLDANYKINDYNSKCKILNEQIASVRNALSKLNSISYSISKEIDDITDDIEKAETESNV